MLEHWPFMRHKDNRLTGKGRVLVFDMEAVGLLHKIRKGKQQDIHVIHLRDKETGEVFTFFDPYKKRSKEAREKLRAEGTQSGYLRDAIHMMNTCDVLISQNFLGYDMLAIEKAMPNALMINFEDKPRKSKKRRRDDYPFRLMDTLVMSQLLNPDRRAPYEAYALGRGNVGPHSIEAFGIKYGNYKPENEDWSKLTDHMLHRCAVDVEIGTRMYDDLMVEWEEQSDIHPITGLGIEDAYRMEAFFFYWMSRQEQLGFAFDMNLAWKLIHEIDKKIEKIVAKVQPKLPLRLKMKKLDKAALEKAEDRNLVKPKFRVSTKKKITHGSSRSTNWSYVTQKGVFSETTRKDYNSCVGAIADHKDPIVSGPYTPLVWEEVGLGNRESVRKMLYELGWRGVNLTEGEASYLEEHGDIPYEYAGKIDQDSLDAWLKKDGKIPKWARSVIDYYVLTHRRGVISNKKDEAYFKENGTLPTNNGKKGLRGLVGQAISSEQDVTMSELVEKFGIDYWLKGEFSKDEEFRVHGVTFSIGTNTFRCRHSVIVNIPSRGLYGKEMRSLFIATKGYKILGADGSGLELRMLSHFMNDKEYESILLDGDIHSHNQSKAGLALRDDAKRFIYAFLYGSGMLGLSVICAISLEEMEARVDQFLAELPKLKDLIERVKSVANSHGYFKAVDGRHGRVRKANGKAKEHTALNVLLQMTGSLCMKWGLYFAVKEMQKRGIEPRLVANQHDEIQAEVPESEVTEISYKIKAKAWKVEEKEVMLTESGEQYAAPEITETKKDKKGEPKSYRIRRKHHEQGDLICKAFEGAGKYLGIRTPLAGEYKVADSWAGTH